VRNLAAARSVLGEGESRQGPKSADMLTSAFVESECPPRWVGAIASDGEHSCGSASSRDPFATHPSISDGKAGARFCHLGGVGRTLPSNGKQPLACPGGGS
jgi:hypothetical protein